VIAQLPTLIHRKVDTAMQARASLKGRVVSATLCGAHVDSAVLAKVLNSR